MKRLKVIACEIAFRELCYCASHVSTIVDFVFMTKGLHDKGAERMRTMLQEEIGKVDIYTPGWIERDIEPAEVEDDFTIIPPNSEIIATNDDNIIGYI